MRRMAARQVAGPGVAPDVLSLWDSAGHWPTCVNSISVTKGRLELPRHLFWARRSERRVSTNSTTWSFVFKCLSENRRGLAHFAVPWEQNVPVPLSSAGSRIGS